MQHYPICSSVFSFKQKSEDYQAFLILCFLRLYNYAESGLSKRFSEHLKTTETGASKKRSQDYWSMRRWSSIPQSPTRKAFPCVDKINILGYWGVRWGPDGRGLLTCQIEIPLPLTWPCFLWHFVDYLRRNVLWLGAALPNSPHFVNKLWTSWTSHLSRLMQ